MTMVPQYPLRGKNHEIHCSLHDPVKLGNFPHITWTYYEEDDEKKKREQEEEEEEEGEKEMMSCQDLKGMYKEYGCCGNPNKMIEMEKEGARRLTGIGGGIVDGIQKALKNAETSDGPDGALRLARKMMKAIAPTMEAAYRKSK
mmetsp:Transcript_3720/g.6641  ORF Transcript_3720/g.6641 Transcript_3720/m.6641 type:complete len:144 (-) Transcript_3720:146-577(-)